MKSLKAILSVALIALLLPSGQALAQSGVVKIGAGVLTEQIILAEMTKVLLEENGTVVETHYGLAPPVMRAALEAGRLDVYWDYTGQALVVYQKNPDRGILVDPAKCYQAVAEADAKLDLVWGRYLPANFTYGVLMNRQTAERLNVVFFSDLAKLLPPEPVKKDKDQIEEGQEGTKSSPDQAEAGSPKAQAGDKPAGDGTEDQSADNKTGQRPSKDGAMDQQSPDQTEEQAAEAGETKTKRRKGQEFLLGMSPEFMERPDGWRAFANRFELPVKSTGLYQADQALLFSGLDEGKIDAVIGPVIDSRVILYDLIVIPLPSPFFPAYNPAPVWRRQTAEALTGVRDKLDRMSQGLTDAVMTRLVWQVEINHTPAEEVARTWLEQAGLKD